MDTFADYILAEKNLASKMEIVYYLSKKEKVFFDKSVVFKTELTRLFLKCSKLELDENLILTACLLCNCKKVNNVKDINEIKSYAKNGANYLRKLGFNKQFCKICEEINRYSGSTPREKESDVLELIEQFGGMILDRPERIGLKPDEALVLLVHRNLKDEYNRYIEVFNQFINMLEEMNMGEISEIRPLRKLTKIFNETDGLKEFIKKITNNYEIQIDSFISKKYKEVKSEMFEQKTKDKIPLFTEETTKKIIGNIEKQNIINKEVV